MKEELEKKRKISVATKRKKVLELIRKLESRQEFPPLLGPLINKSFAEPLHNANNAWQYLHKKILEFAISKTNLPEFCTDYSILPVDSPFRKYLSALKLDVKATRLRKKVITWCQNVRAKTFDYRFTGKERKLLWTSPISCTLSTPFHVLMTQMKLN